jgi:hypothetical protein
LRRALDEIRGVLRQPDTGRARGGANRFEELLRSVLDRWQLPATWSIEGDLAEVSPSVLEAASSVIRGRHRERRQSMPTAREGRGAPSWHPIVQVEVSVTRTTAAASRARSTKPVARSTCAWDMLRRR